MREVGSTQSLDDMIALRVCRLASAVSLRRPSDALAHAQDLPRRQRLDLAAIA